MATEIFYTAYAFDDMVINLQNRLAADDAWKDIYRSSTGEMLIEFLAYVLEHGLFYTERRAQESFLSTAQNRSSIINLVSLINYTPKRQTSATGNLIFTLEAALTKIVHFPKYTECQTSAGVKYMTNESAAIEKGQTTVTISSIQGELIQKEVTADGSANQEYLITDTNVENSASTINPTLRVIVDGLEWTLVTSFLASETNSTHYKIINELDGNVSVRFGDGVNGLTPANGLTIRIQYVKTIGADGNVSFPNKITTINDVIRDEDGAIVTTVSVDHTGSFLGGDAEESKEEIRSEAPQVFKTGDRAVNKADFISLLRNFAGVADANVWGENEVAEANGVPQDVEMLNKVNISTVLQDWALPDSTFKTTLSDFLFTKSMIAIKYEFITPVFLTVLPFLQVTVASGNSTSQAQSDIDEAVQAEFLLGTTTSLGTIIKYSQVLSAIHNLDTVAYATMLLEIVRDLSSTFNSVNDFGITLNALPVKPETTRLFVNGSFSVVDIDNTDGTGSFTASGITGTITYATGVVVIDITPTPSSINVRYQQDENENIVPTFNQICRLHDDITDIETIAVEVID